MDRAIVTTTMILSLAFAGMLAVQPQPVAAAGQDHSADLSRELELTNAQRQSAGIKPLVLSPQLSNAAQSYTQVLSTDACFDHTCGVVPNFADRIGQVGYTGWTALAENIAAGYSTPEAVVAGWMASPGHRANILSASYSEIGVGVVSGGRFGTYWAQEFGSRSEASDSGAAVQAPDAAPDAGGADSPSPE